MDSLHELGFVERRENVVFLGPPGVGKTHLAISLAIAAAQSAVSRSATTMPRFVPTLALLFVAVTPSGRNAPQGMTAPPFFKVQGIEAKREATSPWPSKPGASRRSVTKKRRAARCCNSCFGRPASK
jgi:hypothetical protein